MTEPRKRVVLLHRSGLHRIIGTFDPSVHTARDFIEFQIVQGGKTEQTGASLLKMTPRYVLYRQIMEPPKKGQFGEFHPRFDKGQK